MLHRRFVNFFPPASLVVGAALATAWCWQDVAGQQEPADPAAVEDAPNGVAEGSDPFEIPDGNAKQIHAFMKRLEQTGAKGETEDEQAEYARQLMRTMVEASEKLLAAKPSPSQARDAHEYRLMALTGLASLGEPGAEEQLLAAIDVAKSSRQREVATIGWRAYLSYVTDRWRDLDEAAKADFKGDLVEAVNDKLEPIDVSIVAVTANRLERPDPEFVVDLLNETLPAFRKSKDSKIRRILADYKLEGLNRRLNLPGKTMKISGTLLSGKKVDWDSYRGKVVLVDFWATWCGPCRAEVPNLLEMYKAYQDKGFEVLGVSLDETPKDANEYVAEMQLPWDSIFPQNKAERGWNHPLAEYYGISGIPTAILVDKDGKVVHMNARGEYLREELQRLLGDPAPSADAGDANQEQPTGDS